MGDITFARPTGKHTPDCSVICQDLQAPGPALLPYVSQSGSCFLIGFAQTFEDKQVSHHKWVVGSPC